MGSAGVTEMTHYLPFVPHHLGNYGGDMVSFIMAEGWSEQKCSNAFISLCIMLAEKVIWQGSQ